MEFRSAEECDIPEIISLLRLGLGESLIPKTERYWRWKHLANPFGNSSVLLAVDGNRIIGVRTFMRWQWKSGEEVFNAVRGVDTVIHPDYQGNGIFGKLTLALVNECRQQGSHLLYSTPNGRSKRGYLKLGWEATDNLPVNVRITKPFSMAVNLLYKNKNQATTGNDGSVHHYLNNPGLARLITLNDALQPSRIITAHTIQTLRWRYADVPVAQYFAAGSEEDGLKALFFYRIKNTRAGKELRITDVFLDSLPRGEDLKIILKRKIREHRVDYITSGSFGAVNIISGVLSVSKKAIGPVVNVRNIMMPDMNRFAKFAGWSPSFGDLELF